MVGRPTVRIGRLARRRARTSRRVLSVGVRLEQGRPSRRAAQTGAIRPALSSCPRGWPTLSGRIGRCRRMPRVGNIWIVSDRLGRLYRISNTHRRPAHNRARRWLESGVEHRYSPAGEDNGEYALCMARAWRSFLCCRSRSAASIRRACGSARCGCIGDPVFGAPGRRSCGSGGGRRTSGSRGR